MRTKLMVNMNITMIQWVVVLTLGILFSCGTAGAERAKEVGLVAHYTFDEEDGTVLHDTSGNGIDGVVHNATWIKWTKMPGGGGALKFGVTDSYVDFAQDSAPKLAGDMTIMAWVKLEADIYPNANTNWTIVDCEDYKKSGFLVRIEGDTRVIVYRVNQAGSTQADCGKVSLANNTFYHLAVTQKGEMATLYINGTFHHRFSLPLSSPGSAHLQLSSKGQSFEGLIDDLKIYKRALDAEEVASAYKEQAASHTPEFTSTYEEKSTVRDEPPARPAGALVLHYDFSERDGDVLHDKSGNGHDALINGAQWVTTEHGAALDFDGVHDFLSCGNPPGLKISGALALVVWVRTYPPKGNKYVLSKHGWNIYIDGDTLLPHLEIRSAENKRWDDLAATQAIRSGEWNLIVAVHDPASRQMRIFVNGQPAGEMTRADDSIGAVYDDPLVFGKYYGWDPEFNGLLGGFMVFNKTLSTEEIAELYKERPDNTLMIIQHRLTVTPRYYYRAKKLTTDLQLQPRGPLASQQFIASVELLDADGKVRGKTEINLGADYRAHAELAMPGEPGKYTIRSVVRRQEDILVQTTVPIEVKPLLQTPSWIGSQVGISRDVPLPWTPLKIKQKSDLVVVEPWGRRYEFKPDSLVSAIYVGEQNLLASPVRLAVQTSAGKTRQAQSLLSVTESTADRVRLSYGKHPVQINVTIDYDGMTWFNWQISNLGEPLAGLMLEIPLVANYARYLWYYPIHPGRPFAEQKPGFLPEMGFTSTFLPALWLGDEDRGLQWFAESDEGWHLNQPDRAIEIVRQGDRVTLYVHMVDTPTDVGKSISGGFGLYATPVKPWGKTPWDYIPSIECSLEETIPWYESSWDKRVEEDALRTLTFFETWNSIHSYVRTSPEKEKKLPQMVKVAHERGIQALLYYGGFISSLAPEAEILWDECLRLPAGGWDEYMFRIQPRQKLFRVCYNSVWQDLIVDGIARTMDEFGLDGVYLDGVGDVIGCINTYHGCGYVASDGSVRPTYPIFANRKILERIYKIVKSRKPEGQVMLHNSGMMFAPILAFATSYYEGEQFSNYQDKFLLDFLPLDTIRTEFIGRQWGVPLRMIEYRLPGTQHQKTGVFLLHDVLIEADLKINAKICRLFDKFERNNATWLPYWANSQFVNIEPGLGKVSLYHHPQNGLLVVILNTGREAEDVMVQINLDKFKNLEQATAMDGITGQEVPMAHGRFSQKLGSLDWRLIWVKP